MNRLLNKSGQSFIELTGLILCLIVALMTARFYLSRAIQGRIREASDEIGEQYDAQKTVSDMTTFVLRDVYTDIYRESQIRDGKEGFDTWEHEVTYADDVVHLGEETVGP